MPEEAVRALPLALEVAQHRAEPADQKFVAIQLEETGELFSLPNNWEHVVKAYFEVFEDASADLVLKACKYVRMNHRYPTFPKPGDFRAVIADEIESRKQDLIRILALKDVAVRQAKRGRERTAAAFDAAVEERPNFADMKRCGLNTPKMKRMDTHASD